MIHRQNWLDVRAYLRHMQRVRQNDSQTVKRARAHLRHLLEWADETALPRARHIDPTFPAYLLTARCDGRQKPLAPASIIKCLATARQYFDFTRREHPLRYKAVSESWIELLQPPRQARAEAALPIRQFYTLAEVRSIASVSVETLREERAQVAVCMLFLSGMRADALASLPISCVDLPNRALAQLPERGVRTKNRKAAVTYLLEIPDLLELVTRWDKRARDALPPSALWYAALTRDGMTVTPAFQAFEGRHSLIARDLRSFCDRARLPYKPPHQLRHGHIVFARSHARTPDEIKAISQNVMHANSIITDQVYSGLVNDDVRAVIARLGKQKQADTEQLLRLLDQLRAQITGSNR